MPDPSIRSGSPRAQSRGGPGPHTSAHACRRCVSRRPASTRSSKSSRSISRTAFGSWWRAGRPRPKHGYAWHSPSSETGTCWRGTWRRCARRMRGHRSAPGASAGSMFPRCLAGFALRDPNVEEATRLQPHGYPDAWPRDWRDDGHVQRGQRSRDQAPSLSRIRKRRDSWRLGSIWKPAYTPASRWRPGCSLRTRRTADRSRSSVCSLRPRRR